MKPQTRIDINKVKIRLLPDSVETAWQTTTADSKNL